MFVSVNKRPRPQCYVSMPLHKTIKIGSGPLALSLAGRTKESHVLGQTTKSCMSLDTMVAQHDGRARSAG